MGKGQSMRFGYIKPDRNHCYIYMKRCRFRGLYRRWETRMVERVIGVSCYMWVELCYPKAKVFDLG